MSDYQKGDRGAYVPAAKPNRGVRGSRHYSHLEQKRGPLREIISAIGSLIKTITVQPR